MIPHATLPECDAALSHIRAAPADAAPVAQLCLRPESGARLFPDHLDLTVADGIAGDRWPADSWLRQADGTADPRIQVSILATRVVDLVWRDRAGTPHPGDPILVDMDLSERNLPIGTRLQAGTAVLEVSDKFNSGCEKWNAWYGNASLRWLNRPELRADRLRGILARVVRDGRVRLGDPLTRLGP